ncbi:MAG: glycoside hydrolase family 3 N-terminal domain-containing protein, partial [Elusimicrobiota bacterium]
MELQDRLGRPLIISVDHEGGWVLRFSKGLTAFPGNAALGKAGDPSMARRTGLAMGRELSALGIGLNLAPVLDVVGKAYNPGIIIRSFGSDPGAVSRLGAAFIAGLQAGGVRACAKHFPGKGPARQDAHLALPTVRAARAEMSRFHLPPFRAAAAAGVACVMTSHAVYPALDPSRKPATFSRRIAHGLLRARLGCRGVLICDDLCMGAVTRDRSIPQAALEAFEAGHDLLIIAHAPQAQREAHQLLVTALQEGRIGRQRWALSLGRVRGLTRRPPRPGPLPPADDATARAVSRAALEILRRGTVPLPLDLSGGPRIAVLWPDLREVKDRFTFEGGVEGPWKRLRSRLSRWPARMRFFKTPLLSGGEVGSVLKGCRDADIVLFFCFEAMRF